MIEEAKIIKVTKKNIDNEHICCAFSDKKCVQGYEGKKSWLREQFTEGYVFRKLDVRGKVFIEYGPAENGWLPIDAPGYMLINCFWVSGKFKGKGYGKTLLKHCLEDSKGKEGVVVVVASKKQPFMSDKRFLINQGFQVVDEAPPYFELLYLPLKNNAVKPKFRDSVREAKSPGEDGIAVYYTKACPYNDYYVNVVLRDIALEKDIPFKAMELSREAAQNHFVPHSLYSVFYKGAFITQHVLSEKAFDKFFKDRL